MVSCVKYTTAILRSNRHKKANQLGHSYGGSFIGGISILYLLQLLS